MADPETIRRQHEEILQHVQELTALKGSADRAATVQRVDALHAVLERHFAAEEEGGYFAELREPRPDLEHRFSMLEAQHEQMLAALEGIRRDGGSLAMDELNSRVTGVLDTLRAHEAAERELLQGAVLRDIGVGD